MVALPIASDAFRLRLARHSLLLAALALAGCATHPLPNGIPNFAPVAPALYRGGQPTAAGWAYLRTLGVTNIIKLNLEPENAPADFSIHPFPISPWQEIFGPVASDLEAAYALLLSNLQSNIPTLVHCTEGANRTGALIILYRLRISGWPKPAAIAEANLYGWPNTLPALKDYIAQQP